MGDPVRTEARNLIGTFTDRAAPARILIRDRDAKYSAAFDEVFRSEGIRIIRTPVRAPRANAVMERWFSSLRPEAAASPCRRYLSQPAELLNGTGSLGETKRCPWQRVAPALTPIQSERELSSVNQLDLTRGNEHGEGEAKP